MTDLSKFPRDVPVRRSSAGSSANLADVLERVLDKGMVIAGDIRINLLDIELLTIKVRLLVASVDKAKEMGVDWWEGDSFSSAQSLDGDDDADRAELASRVKALEERLTDDTGSSGQNKQSSQSKQSKAKAGRSR